jgi:hypothetical protein
VIEHAARLTIPARLNDHLATLRPGRSIDFHATFLDELPDERLRTDLLEFLRDRPREVRGIIDAATGRVYAVSPSRLRRLGSVILTLGLVLLGFGLAIILTRVETWTGAGDWPIAPARLADLMVAYLFIVVGAAVHLLVDILKQARSAEQQTITAIGDLMLWAHVKEIPNAIAAVSLWVGLVGIAFTTDSVSWELAFFVGYSIDSFVDLFLARFSARASAGVAASETRVGRAVS